MLRCAVFTLVGYHNYGNRLVCAATCKIFASLGVDAEIIVEHDEKRPFFAILGRKIESVFKCYLLEPAVLKMFPFAVKYLTGFPFLIKFFVKRKRKYIARTLGDVRYQRFVDFSAEHITEKDYGLKKHYFPPSFPESFDFFVIGGDQIWNPFFSCTGVPGTIYFLPFAGNDKRAFMFSTSFGVSKDVFLTQMAKVPGLIDDYREAVAKMSFISCREDSGIDIINSLSGTGQVILDPTMILTREEWLAIAKMPDFSASRFDGKSGYALLYFLGDLPDFLKERIQKICAEKNLEPVLLNNLSDEAYVTDPSEFLYLMANADVIYTDSFHGAAFSILFETPFFVFERLGKSVDMSSRLDTLLQKFNLESRLIKKSAGNFFPEDSDFNMDFSNAREILSEEREKAIRFLKTALSEMAAEERE